MIKHGGDPKRWSVEVNDVLNWKAESEKVAGVEGELDHPGPSHAT